MTVKELIQELKYCDPDQRVVLKPENSRYVYDIDQDSITFRDIRNMWGPDFDACILTGPQIGSI